MKKTVNYIAGIVLFILAVTSFSVTLKITNNFKTTDKAVVGANYKEMVKGVKKFFGIRPRYKINKEGTRTKFFYEHNSNNYYLKHKDYYNAELEYLINSKEKYYNSKDFIVSIDDKYIKETTYHYYFFTTSKMKRAMSINEYFCIDDHGSFYLVVKANGNSGFHPSNLW